MYELCLSGVGERTASGGDDDMIGSSGYMIVSLECVEVEVEIKTSQQVAAAIDSKRGRN